MPADNALLESLGPIFAVVFAGLLLVQWRWPLRRQHFSALRRLVRNGILAVPGLLVSRLILVPIPFIVSLWATRNQFGLFNWLHLPSLITIGLGVLLYDYAYYWWHKFMHLAPLFWRFHNVHHTDLDMDVSTASRFHLGEVLFSIFFRVAVVSMLGLRFGRSRFTKSCSVWQINFSIRTSVCPSGSSARSICSSSPRACTEFITRSCNAKPIRTGAPSFAGGIKSIARCGSTLRRTRSPSVSPPIAMRAS